MKRITILFLVCLFLMTPAPVFAQRLTDNWHITGYTKYRDAVFADISRITASASGTKSTWVKIAPASKSQYFQMINEYLQTVNKSGNSFRSIEILCEIDCVSHLIRFTKFVYFDTSGNIIHEAYETNLGWLAILQGNIWYNVEKEVCGQREP
jgi:hypothetical protein